MKHSLPAVLLPFGEVRRGLLLLILFLLVGCSREDRAFVAMLDRADSLMQTHPDSALALLDAAGSQEAKESGSQGGKRSSLSMRYRLLRVKAEDKLYKPITGYESLVIDTLVPYFRKHGTPYLNATALFYAGRICTDKGDAPQAIDYYQQTLDALPKGEDPRFRGLVHIQIGWLLHYQDLYQEAILQFKEACRYEKEAKDTTYIIHILESIGEDYMLQQKNDSALMYLHQAIDLAEQSKNHSMWIKVMMETARFYLFQDSIQSARNCLMPVLADYDSSDISPVYVNAAMLYYKENNVDSTLYFCRGLLEKGTVYAKYTAYKALAAMSLQGRNSKEALQYQNRWEECDDSIRKLESRNTIARMHSLYNYQLREKQLAQVKLDKFIQISTLSTIIALLSVLLLLAGCASVIIRNQRNRERRRRQQTQQLLMLEKERNGIVLRQNLEEIDQLKEECSLLSREHHERQSLLEQRIRQLELENQVIIVDKEKQTSNYNLLMNTAVVKEIESFVKSSRPMDKSQFDNLSHEIDNLFPRFRKTLFTLHRMSETEYRVCMLMKLEMSHAEMGILVSKARNSIAMIQKRLYDKMFKAPDSQPFNNLTELIKNL